MFKNLPANNLFFIAIALIPPLFFYVLFSQFFPNANGFMGHDYYYFGPKHVAGYYWFKENGLFEIPWFTPAFCGGVPLYPNPQSSYYSIHQFMMFLFEPVTAYKLSFFLIALLGYTGMYHFLRAIFKLDKWLALLGATLFMFNTFFTMRTLIGHLTLHVFMLAPWLYYTVFKSGMFREKKETMTSLLFCTLSALNLAYMFYAGGVHFIPPLLLSGIIILLVYGWYTKTPIQSYILPLLITVGIMLLLDASKLVAAFSFFGQFKRDFYPLPGTDSILYEFTLIFKSLFAGAPDAMPPGTYTNSDWLLARHEFEFSIGPVPLAILLGAPLMLLYAHKKYACIAPLKIHYAYLSGIILLCLIPFFLNYYTPEWNAILKQIPIIKSSSNLYRWFIVYIIPIILISLLLLKHVPLQQLQRVSIVILGIGFTLFYIGMYDKGYYHKENYHAENLQKAYQVEPRPPISEIGIIKVPNSNSITSSDTFFGLGKSSLVCYMSIFGYRMESFPQKTLRPGSIYQKTDGYYNLKNPACYVYPEENRCSVGDHFKIPQREQMEQFTHYKPFEFKSTPLQKTANYLTLVTLLLSLGFVLWKSPGIARILFQKQAPYK